MWVRFRAVLEPGKGKGNLNPPSSTGIFAERPGALATSLRIAMLRRFASCWCPPPFPLICRAALIPLSPPLLIGFVRGLFIRGLMIPPSFGGSDRTSRLAEREAPTLVVPSPPPPDGASGSFSPRWREIEGEPTFWRASLAGTSLRHTNFLAGSGADSAEIF